MKEYKNCPLCESDQIENSFTTKDYFLTQEEFSLYKCRSCDFVFTNPRPDKEELHKYYKSEEYYSHAQKSKSLIGYIYDNARNIAMRNKMRILESFAKGNDLLDYGCGGGAFINYCSKNNWNVVGVEPDEVAAKAASINGLKVFNSIEDLNESDSFDIISMWHVLEHIPDLNKVFSEIVKKLKTDATIIIAVPNRLSWDAINYGKYWAAWDVPRHLYHFSSDNIKYLVEKQNLTIVDTLPMKMDSYYVSMLSEKYIKGRNNFVKAFINGYKSNNKASKSKEYSSMIFVCKKNA